MFPERSKYGGRSWVYIVFSSPTYRILLLSLVVCVCVCVNVQEYFQLKGISVSWLSVNIPTHRDTVHMMAKHNQIDLRNSSDALRLHV